MNAGSMLRTHWKYGSSIVHAGVENLPHVLVPDSNGNFTVTIDSRMKAPNKTVLDLAQRCFSAAGLLRWRLNRGFTPEHIQWAEQMSIIAHRHADEPTDIKSVHD